ncbi:MAG TPA: DUF1990 family protein [Vulgatibacter sp.]
MAEWRWLRGWSQAELAERLGGIEALPLNFEPCEVLTTENGWNAVQSHAVIAREAPGPPAAAFQRSWRAISIFEHSDPRIVIGHFRGDVPLERRRLLLELHALGLRFLCPVRVGSVRADEDGARTSRGFTIETLEGHIERGRELFLLEKDHANGEVRFRIEAAWRDGDFPAAWAHLGFRIVGRRYQRAWHRLAHLRLRRLAAGLDVHDLPGGGALSHEGHRIPFEPVQFYAQRGMGRRGIDVEQEVEDMRRDTFWRAAGLGALAGVRSLGPPALIAWRREGRRRRLSPLLAALGAGEMVADKFPIPSRTRPASVVGRAISGAVVGGLSARRRERRGAAALVGATAAVASTYVSGTARAHALRRSRALGYVVAAVEDAVVLGAGSRLAGAAPRR